MTFRIIDEQDDLDSGISDRVYHQLNDSFYILSYEHNQIGRGEREFPSIGFRIVKDYICPSDNRHKIKVVEIKKANLLREISELV